MIKKKWIPFKLWPANWGLTGSRLEEARAEYYLEGKELDQKLLDLKYTDRKSLEYRQGCCDILHKYNEITDQEYEKECHTLGGRSYFKVIEGIYESHDSHFGQMSFELDWNELFVNELIAVGWPGKTDNEIVNAWFEDACRQMLVDEDLPPAVGLPQIRKRRSDDGVSEYS